MGHFIFWEDYGGSACKAVSFRRHTLEIGRSSQTDSAGFMLELLSYPEDGNDTLLRNIGIFSSTEKIVPPNPTSYAFGCLRTLSESNLCDM
jgi:hypothetical protein